MKKILMSFMLCLLAGAAFSQVDYGYTIQNRTDLSVTPKTHDKSNVVYRVQVLTKTTREDWHVKEIEAVGDLYIEEGTYPDGRNFYRYMICPENETELRDAMLIRKIVSDKFGDAMIVKYYRGRRQN